jgi:hypothetical protein
MPVCLDTRLIGPYVQSDESSRLVAVRGRPVKITDAELVCLSVAQCCRTARAPAVSWARTQCRLRHPSPYLPKQPGYNKPL